MTPVAAIVLERGGGTGAGVSVDMGIGVGGGAAGASAAKGAIEKEAVIVASTLMGPPAKVAGEPALDISAAAKSMGVGGGGGGAPDSISDNGARIWKPTAPAMTEAEAEASAVALKSAES